jgi:hypothetical protein
LPDEVELDLARPYTGCRVCGALFQSATDRLKMPTTDDLFAAMQIRKNWSIKHAKSHTEREHLNLAMSGMWCTPEAAQIFASYGVIALSDMVLFDESEDALRKSSPIPVKEVESVLRTNF